MKTYMVTYHAEFNFGAVLQAYGLQKYLHNQHISNEIIDIRSKSSIEKQKVLFPLHTVKDIVNDAFSLLKYRKLPREFKDFRILLKMIFKKPICTPILISFT